MKILLIDDSKTFLDLLGYTLSESPYSNYSVAYDGQEGYKQAMSEKYNLLIIDYNMPKMNGIELIAKLRQEPQYAKTPMLILSTETSNDYKLKAREAGATGWMTKPFLPGELIKAVGICLGAK